MKFEVYNKKISQIEADIEIIFVVNSNFNHKWIYDREELATLGFKGKDEEAIFLPHVKRVYSAIKDLQSDSIRIGIANALKTICKTKYTSVKIALYTEDNTETNVRALVEGVVLSSYKFDKYKSKKDQLFLEIIKISTEDYEDYNEKTNDIDLIEKTIKEGIIIAEATNDAKEIVNTTPYDMTPEKLAEYSQKLAKTLKNVNCFIGDKKFLKEQKMGAFLAVAKASINEPKLIHLTYKPKNPLKKFVFVGKGLTYDSGGLSLKPSEYMVNMKSDKSGACAAIHIIKVASELNLPFEVHAVIGAAENMIGGNAYKPDDVLISRSGKTIEVRNTDAEGRLVLCDCLDFAQDLKPDYLVDLATLTGACVVALGEYTTGIMGNNNDLEYSFKKSACKSGELTGILPFNKYLTKLLKSEIADISNIANSRYGGAITAGLFLNSFIKEEYKDKWLHLDIAGPAYREKSWGYNQSGASGAGVRMCIYWLKDFINKEKNIVKEDK